MSAVCIDEFQRVPDLLAAIKSELNRDRRAGRFVLAGSARHEAVPELADFLTCRVELLRLWPFAMAELEPGAPSIVDRLFDGAVAQRRTSAMSRAELVDVMLRDGYPIAVGLPPDARARWFGTLATLVVERISDDVTVVRHADTLGRFLRLAATATRGLVHLRDRLGDRFVAGLVLNTGNQAQRVGDRLYVAPVDQLWHFEQN